MRALTEPQRRVLAYIQASDVPPTIRELCEHMGYTTNGVTDVLRALERKGYIERVGVPGQARNLRVIQALPGVMSASVKLALIRDLVDLSPVDVLEQIRGVLNAPSERVSGADELGGGAGC